MTEYVASPELVRIASAMATSGNGTPSAEGAFDAYGEPGASGAMRFGAARAVAARAARATSRREESEDFIMGRSVWRRLR